jgi:tetratricopeptide (TPR) repeat protein
MPDTALPITEYHFERAQQLGDDAEMAKALNEQGLIYYMRGQPDLSIQVLQAALAHTKALGDSTQVAVLYSNIGTLHKEQRQFKEAIRLYSTSLAILEAMDAKLPDQGDLLYNIGLLYREVGLTSLVEEYMDRARSTYKSAGVYDRIGNIWLTQGDMALDQGLLDSAEVMLTRALDIHTRYKNILGQLNCHLKLAILTDQQGYDERSRSAIHEAVQLSQGLGNPKYILETRLQAIEFDLKDGQQTSCSQIPELIAMSEEVGDNQLSRELFATAKECERRRGNHEGALDYAELELKYSDSLRIEEDQVAVIRQAIQSEFEYELNEQALDNQRSQNALEMAQYKRVATIVFGGLILLFIMVFYAQHRFKKLNIEQNELLAEIERLKAQAATESLSVHGRFKLDRTKIETKIEKTLNETDWKVLNILVDDPVIPNREIADKAFLTVDGIGSSLRRMYVNFDIKESKYKKISLLMEAMKISHGV